MTTDQNARYWLTNKGWMAALTTPPLSYVTTATGLVHIQGCHTVRPAHISWPWRPNDDAPGAARACSKCLPGGLP